LCTLLKLHRGDRVKTLNKLRWSGACLGLCLASALFWSRTAAAEVKLVETDGWTFSFDGRVNSFLSGGHGDDFPLPTAGPMHLVMGVDSQEATGVPDVGWASAKQQDINNKYSAIRVRSGMFGNVLGFGLAKQVSDTLVVKGYVALWSTIETLARDKWAPITAEARVGYFAATGPWGTATAGRMLGWLGRTSYDIDVAYGHGYGVGLPCTDALGPACGHIGTGALFPGYSAGISYATPVFGGVQLNYGVYDPVIFATAAAPAAWSRAPYPRQEGALTLTRPFGTMGNSFRIGVEGLFQPIYRVASTTDPTTMLTTKSNVSSSVWGISGGARVEVGPLRLGASGFRGRGIGLGNALQRSVATADDDTSAGGTDRLTYGLRTFTGFYGQLGAMIQKWQLAAGYGMGIVDQLAADKANPNLSVIHSQAGISAAVYYHVSDSVVLALDYFHFKASWYGAPIVDANNIPTGGKLTGELQSLDFLNLGVTYHW
jgi:hypothetical protein